MIVRRKKAMLHTRNIEDAENSIGALPSKRQKTAFGEQNISGITQNQASRAFGQSLSTAVYNF
jgi:hypothetical protein